MSTNTASNTGYGFLHWLVAIILAIALIGLWLAGYGPGGSKCSPAAAVVQAPAPVVAPVAPTPAVVATPAPVAAAPVVAAPLEYKRNASVPAAKLYFGSDKTDLPATTDKTLAEVVAYLKANKDARGYVSGFHDPSGSAERNNYLATTRGTAVAGQLEKLGVSKEQIVPQKPTVTTGTGSTLAEARRVEVTVWSNQ